MRKDQWIGAGLVLTLIVLVGVGLWKTSGRRELGRIAVVRRCQRVMGTSCELAAVVPNHRQALAVEALREAESLLHSLESRMSTWIANSEISQLNVAPAEKLVTLSPQSIEVLRAAEKAYLETDKAFDVTCRPLIELWRDAGQRGVVPNESELTGAREASKWELLELTDTGAVKRSAAARVDLGGIAKGYAIDRAVALLQRAGVEGGLVDVGGDLVCFGQPPAGETWTVDVKDPSGATKLTSLRLPGGAVCTSGNYARFTEIAGKRYSHVIDPRTGRPADAVPSVTVVADTAVTADVWATALSVLGTEGLRRLPDGVEAMIVVGSEDDYQIFCTAGFRDLLEEPLPAGLRIAGREEVGPFSAN